MPQFVISRCGFAEVPVTVTAAPLFDPDQPRRVVALGWISRNGGHVVISDRLIGSVHSAGR